MMNKIVTGIIIVVLLISGFFLWLDNMHREENTDVLKDLKSLNLDKIPSHPKPEKDGSEAKNNAQTEAYNGYAYNIAAEIFHNNENTIYSPASLYFALSVAYDGASDSAKEKIGTLLGLGEETLDYYNTLYTSSVYQNKDSHALYNNLVVGHNGKKDYSIKQDFIDNISRYYRGYIGNLNIRDKEVLKAISDFIYENTNQAFKPEIEVDEDTKAFIFNTARYKDRWKVKMEPGEEGFYFTGRDGKSKETESVFSSARYFYETDSDVDKVKLNLEEGYYLVMARPKTEKYKNFSDQEHLKYLLEDPQTYGADIIFSAPKFEIKSKHDILKLLLGMGYEELVETPSFPHMFEGDTVISKIIQEAKFDFNETGIEAAAYTEIEMKDLASPPGEQKESIIMEFNTPFVYALKNPNGAIAFIGVYEKADDK